MNLEQQIQAAIQQINQVYDQAHQIARYHGYAILAEQHLNPDTNQLYLLQIFNPNQEPQTDFYITLDDHDKEQQTKKAYLRWYSQNLETGKQRTYTIPKIHIPELAKIAQSALKRYATALQQNHGKNPLEQRRKLYGTTYHWQHDEDGYSTNLDPNDHYTACIIKNKRGKWDGTLHDDQVPWADSVLAQKISTKPERIMHYLEKEYKALKQQ